MPAVDAYYYGARGLLAAVQGGPDKEARAEEVAEYLLDDATDVMMRAEDLQTALHHAAGQFGEDQPRIIGMLIDHGAEVDATDCAGRAPLHFAAANGLFEQAALLIKRGATVDARNCYGSTPLHFACAARHQRLATLLLKRGADPNATNNGGWTPYHYAIRGGEGYADNDFTRFLVKQGCVPTEGPTTFKMSHVSPHPKVLSPTGHGSMQG